MGHILQNETTFSISNRGGWNRYHISRLYNLTLAFPIYRYIYSYSFYRRNTSFLSLTHIFIHLLLVTTALSSLQEALILAKLETSQRSTYPRVAAGPVFDNPTFSYTSSTTKSYGTHHNGQDGRCDITEGTRFLLFRTLFHPVVVTDEPDIACHNERHGVRGMCCMGDTRL